MWGGVWAVKRVVTVFLAWCCLLSGCTFGGGARETASTQRTLYLILAWDSSMEGVVLEAAREMVRRVYEISGGTVIMELRESSNVQRDLSSGAAHMGLLDSRRDGGFSQSLSLLAEPFRYQDYLQFTLFANSQEVLELLGEEMEESWGMVPLGAFYQGTDFLFSTGDWLPEEREETALGQSGDLAARPGAGGLTALEQTGVPVAEVADAAERMKLLTDGEVHWAEFSGEELEDIRWPGMDLEAACGYHNINPLWLMANGAFWQQLTDRQRAIVQETVSYLFGNIDVAYLEWEESLDRSFKNWGYFQEESGRRNREIRRVLDEDRAFTPRERYLLELLDHNQLG